MHITSFLISVLSQQQNTVFESKGGSWNASAQFKTKNCHFRSFSGQAHLRTSITMATAKVSGGQKLFEIVSYAQY